MVYPHPFDPNKIFPGPIVFNEDFTQATFKPKLIFFSPWPNQEIVDVGQITVGVN